MGDNVGSIYNDEFSICSNIFIYLFYIAVHILASLSVVCVKWKWFNQIITWRIKLEIYGLP